MKKVLMLIFTVALGVLFTLGGAPSISAQESDVEEFTLEEITVTAEKREENQQKVAIAMEVVTGEDIKIAGKTDLSEILSYVSSAIIQRATDGLRVSLRGLSDDTGAFRSQMQATPTVAINTDGVMTNRKDTGSGLFDVERVEVLYGPQSTLYSSNSPGGIVNIVTASPSTEKYEASGSLEYGNYNLLHTEGAMNVPLSEKLAMRAAFTTEKRDGFLDNGEDDADNKSVRVKTLFNPVDNLSINLTGMLTKTGGMGRSGGVIPFVYQDDVDDPWTFNVSSTVTGQGKQDRTRRSFNANIDWGTGLGSITFVPSYTTSHSDYVNVNTNLQGVTTTTDGKRRSRETGMELRMASDPDFFLIWIIGGTYYQSLDQNARDMRDSDQMSDRTITEDAKAFFANVTYPFTDRLRATGGYRQSWDDFQTDNIEVRPAKGKAGTFESIDETRIMEYGKPDYKVGFEYDLRENIMVYGDHSTSYRVRGMGGGSAETDPERLKAFTLGAKSRFLGNKLQANIAGYLYNYKNYQATQNLTVYFDTDLDGEIDSQTRDPNSSQDGDGRFIGIDLQTSAIIGSKDRLNFSVSWEDSEWSDLFFDYYYETNLIANDTGGYDEVDIEDVSYNGKPMTNTPPWTISASHSHNFFLWNDGTIRTTLTVRYQTDYLLSWKDSDFPNNYQECYRLADFNAAYTSPDGKLTFSVYVNNIENYAVKRGIYGVMQKMVIGEPRTYGAVLSLRY